MITSAAGQAKVAIRIKSFASSRPAEYTTELAGVPITSQNAIDVEMASATPTIIGFVPELTAISSTTGPMTATVAPALIKFVIKAPITATRIANGRPSWILKVVRIFIKLSASHLAAPLDLKPLLNLLPRRTVQ